MDVKKIYRRFGRKFEDMDDYEKMRLYTVTGIITFALLIFVGLIGFFYLRHIGVDIDVDTAGLLGKPAVFLNNITDAPLRGVSIEMDGIYTARVDQIPPKQSAVVYFTMFKPIPPQDYRPKDVTIKSGMKSMTKNVAPLSR